MAEQENTWRKREPISLTCPSGNKIVVRRPGPDLALKASKLPRVLQNPKLTEAERLNIIETLPDAELDKVMGYARVLVADVVISPPLSLHPKEGQLSPDDLPLSDFWWLFRQASAGFPSVPVQLQEGETTVEAVQSFPSGQEPSFDVSDDSGAIQ